jgi:hypothetical protein
MERRDANLELIFYELIKRRQKAFQRSVSSLQSTSSKRLRNSKKTKRVFLSFFLRVKHAMCTHTHNRSTSRQGRTKHEN